MPELEINYLLFTVYCLTLFPTFPHPLQRHAMFEGQQLLLTALYFRQLVILYTYWFDKKKDWLLKI